MSRTFSIGTRKSPLAIAQTELVISSLRPLHPDLDFVMVSLQTYGDEGNPRDLGMGLDSKRAFTRRIEDALLDRQIDAAVHSLKDLPASLGDGLELGAVPRRNQPWDALISRNGKQLHELPPASRIGTSSLRRKSQLLAFRATFGVEELRGNIGTRLRRLDEGGFDALVLAAAGLERLGWNDRATQILPAEIMTPAIGQGALGVEVRADDPDALDIVRDLDDLKTRTETEAERGVARELGGGCNVPMGAVAAAEAGALRIHAMVGSADGRQIVRADASGRSPSEVVKEVTATLRRKGAERLLEEADHV